MSVPGVTLPRRQSSITSPAKARRNSRTIGVRCGTCEPLSSSFTNLLTRVACTEIQRLDGVDKAFQLMVHWQGRLGVRQIKFFYDRQLQSPQGVCPVDESNTPHIVLEANA